MDRSYKKHASYNKRTELWGVARGAKFRDTKRNVHTRRERHVTFNCFPGNFAGILGTGGTGNIDTTFAAAGRTITVTVENDENSCQGNTDDECCKCDRFKTCKYVWALVCVCVCVCVCACTEENKQASNALATLHMYSAF